VRFHATREEVENFLLAIVAKDGRPMMLRERSGDFMRDLISEASGFDEELGLLDAAQFGSCSRDSCVAVIQRDGQEYRLLATRSTTRIDWQSLVQACAQADIAVSDRWLPRSCSPRWLKLDRKMLEQTGGNCPLSP
jgi:competence protein ComEC